jgi:hypothetical protein
MKASVNRVLAGLLALLVWAVAPAGVLAGDQIVYFKNGRALRVLDIREEGEWVYLIISEPKDPAKMTTAEKREGGGVKPEDLAREIGVRASTIARMETARGGAGGSNAGMPTTRTANGVVRNPSAYDGTSGVRGYVVKPPSPEELAKRRATNTERIENTLSQADGPASAAAITRGNAALDNVDMSKTLAGGEMRINQRNLKVPNYIMQRARQVQAQRQQERAARRLAKQQEQLAAASPDSGTPPPTPTSTDPPSEPER